MADKIKIYPSSSPGQRGMSVVVYRGSLTKTDPHKSLLKGKKSRAGRNAQGRITVRHRGGGAKRLLREVDFNQGKVGVLGRVASIEYDPNRSAFIALVVYRDGEKRYILAPLK